MLMFENGLLASFIPEFIMVLAYLFCLVAPELKTDKQHEDFSPQIVQTSTFHSAVSSAYRPENQHFGVDNQTVETEKQFSGFSEFEKLTVTAKAVILPLDGPNKLHFSRPPPSI